MTSYDVIAADTGTLSDTAPCALSASCILAETLSLAPVLAVVKQVSDTLAETCNLAPVTSAAWQGDGIASDTLTITSTTALYKSILVVASETLSLAEAVTPNAILQLLAAEGMNFTALLTINGEQYVVWVANADTLAHSQYAGFNFNSMCRIGNHYYGANDDGIHLLEGSDDAGTSIDYFLTLPETDLGSSKAKRVPKVYMGVSNDGDMHLKIISREGAARVYAFSKTSQGYSESGAKMGRGIKSRYFTFDVYNVDGGDAEVDHLEMFPVILARLINS